MRKFQSPYEESQKLTLLKKIGFPTTATRMLPIWIAGTIGGLLMVALWGSVARAAPPSPLHPASEEARNIANLFWLTFWIAVAVFVVVEGLLLYTLFRFKQKDAKFIPPKIHGSTPLEIAWTMAPALVLLMVFALMVQTMNAAADPPADAMQIKVTGHQWWWEFQYPELGITTANELYVPVGQPVMAELTSNNVIHSFWIPQLAGKTDVIPGQTNTMWFQADRPGNFRGQCAELCGAQHANMNFMVIAVPPDQFNIWAERQQQPRPEALADSPGEQIFLNGQCVACHTIDGTDSFGILGPNLTHFGSRQTIAGLMLENTPENLARWLADPQAVKPLNKMVINELSQDEIQALTQYLSNLR